MSETPILDLEQEPPKPRKRTLTRFIGVLIGLALVAVLIMGDEGMLPNWGWPPFNGLLMLPGFYAAVAVHEMGHLLAGASVGIESGGVAIGPFLFLKSGNNWTFQFHWLSLGGFFKPLMSKAGFQASRYAWMVAGGPVASLALSIVCWICWARGSSGVLQVNPTLFWISLATFVLTVAPYTSSIYKSDGALFALFVWQPRLAHSWIALLGIQSEETRGLRPAEWNEELFQQLLLIHPAAPEYSYCQLMAYYRLVDQDSAQAALGHLENALGRSAACPKTLRQALYMEAAYSSAGRKDNVEQARTWLARARALGKLQTPDAVEAAIAMCDGRYEAALAHWGAARAQVKRRRLDSGLVRFALDAWANCEASCRAALQA